MKFKYYFNKTKIIIARDPRLLFNETRSPQALRSTEYQTLYTDFLSDRRIFAYQQPHYNNE